MRFFDGISRPSISIEDPRASTYHRRAQASGTAAIALLQTDLRVRWSNDMFTGLVTCSGAHPTPRGIVRFLSETGLREQILDVFTSGRKKHTSLALPNHITRRHWRGMVFGCRNKKPKQVLVILEPCVALIQFESDSGRVTWRNEQVLHKLSSAQSYNTGPEMWTGPPFREIDWNELLVRELESPAGKDLNAIEIGGGRLEDKVRIRFVADGT